MKPLSLMLAAACIAMLSETCHAAGGFHMTGEELTKYCLAFRQFKQQAGRATSQERHDAALCIGYVEGILDSESLGGGSPSHFPAACPPNDANSNTLAEVVAIFLDQNPALRHHTGYHLVKLALEHSYPCKR